MSSHCLYKYLVEKTVNIRELTFLFPEWRWEKSILVVGSGTIPGSEPSARKCDTDSSIINVLNIIILKGAQKLKIKENWHWWTFTYQLSLSEKCMAFKWSPTHWKLEVLKTKINYLTFIYNLKSWYPAKFWEKFSFATVWVCRHLYYCGAKTLRWDAPPDWTTFQAKLPSNGIQTQDLLIENLAHCTKTATGLSILRALHLLGIGIDSHVWNHHSNNVMGTASVFQLSGPMFDSQRITLCIIVNSR